MKDDRPPWLRGIGDHSHAKGADHNEDVFSEEYLASEWRAFVESLEPGDLDIVETKTITITIKESRLLCVAKHRNAHGAWIET